MGGAGALEGGRGPRGSGRGPIHRSRSFDPDPELRAMDMDVDMGPDMMGYGVGPRMPARMGPAPGYQHHQLLYHRPQHAGGRGGVGGDPDDDLSRCGMFWRYVWKLSSCLCSHVTLVSLVIAYCLLGAKTFEMLEKDNEREVGNGHDHTAHRSARARYWY